LMRHYVQRGEKGLVFGQQEIFGFSRAERERQAAAGARRKLYLTTKQIDGFAGRQTKSALKIKKRGRRGSTHRAQRKRRTRCPRLS
jgi:hypothetical protein